MLYREDLQDFQSLNASEELMLSNIRTIEIPQYMCGSELSSDGEVCFYIFGMSEMFLNCNQSKHHQQNMS
jgi:hypothetical protein